MKEKAVGRPYETVFSYPLIGPRDIYGLGVPEDASITKLVPSKEAQEILEKSYLWHMSILENIPKRTAYITPGHSGNLVESDFAEKYGLICLEQLVQGKVLFVDDGDVEADWPARRRIYFDPKKNYMWVRFEEHMIPDAKWQIDKKWKEELPLEWRNMRRQHMILEVTEFGQTEDGVWYPVRVNETIEYDGED